MLYYLIGIAFFVWVIFFGGAEKLENTLLGYLEFGPGAEKATYIRFGAWLGIISCIALIYIEATS